jgi:hypothetical protein
MRSLEKPLMQPMESTPSISSGARASSARASKARSTPRARSAICVPWAFSRGGRVATMFAANYTYLVQ